MYKLWKFRGLTYIVQRYSECDFELCVVRLKPFEDKDELVRWHTLHVKFWKRCKHNNKGFELN